MKKVFKIILILILIISGFSYILKNKNVKEEEKSNRVDYLSSIIKDNSKKLDDTNSNDKIILVSKKYSLDRNYKLEKLVIPNIVFSDTSSGEEKYVAESIRKPLEDMINAAKDEGVILYGNSGYRSYKFQEQLYKNKVKLQGKEYADAYVAKPGFSEHQTGLCIDITNKDKYFVEGTKEADWLSSNCYKFGFIIRYPKDKKSITGIEYEPWHIRYVGLEAAKYIYYNGITLEEYLGK